MTNKSNNSEDEKKPEIKKPETEEKPYPGFDLELIKNSIDESRITIRRESDED